MRFLDLEHCFSVKREALLTQNKEEKNQRQAVYSLWEEVDL